MAFFVGAAMVPSGTVHAGPCTAEIDRISAAMDALAANQEVGTAHQSRAADLHRQPTPYSVERGREQAITDERHDRAALERARAADARGDSAGCNKALSDALRGKSPR